jgi:hypothetical protein
VRRHTLLVVVAGAILVPATPAFAHGGDAPEATSYRTTITGISTPEKGLSVRTVEGGARLELSNRTGHPVEVLGYAGEPYLDIRPDGTYQNAVSPAAYLNATLSGDQPVPSSADPTAPPVWRKISTTTTVRWHDQRTHWLSPGRPAAAVADPGTVHRLRNWTVPLRDQARVFEVTGTLDWVPPPRAAFWWLGAGLLGLTAIALALRWPGTIGPLAVIAGLAPLSYAASRAADGGTPPLVLIPAGLLALAAAWRRPPFFLALTGAVVAIFGGFGYASSFHAAVLPVAAVFPVGAVLPVAGPDWIARSSVVISAGLGVALAVTGVRQLRHTRPEPVPDPVPASGLSSSA